MDCNEALRLRLGDDAFSIRGLVYLKLKKLELALTDYDSALQGMRSHYMVVASQNGGTATRRERSPISPQQSRSCPTSPRILGATAFLRRKRNIAL